MATLVQRLIDLTQRIAAEFKSRPKGLSFGIQGKTTADEGPIPYGTAPYTFTPVAANSRAVALVAATTSTQFLIRSGATQIGTLTFGAGATVGVFVFSGSFAKDAAVTLAPPATPDAALSGVSGFMGA